jgi:putative colanic acid biosynthesis acetyltransferase WcaF
MESVRQSKVRLGDFDATDGFDRGVGKVKEVCWYLTKMAFFLTAIPFPSSLKSRLLRLFGAKVGNGVVIKPRVNIHMPWKLVVGNNVWIGEEAFLLNFDRLTIGNNVCISQRAFICGGNHDYRTPSMPYRNGPIVLENGCWIGASCFVGPGVTVSVDAVLTAGSIITTSVAANGVYRTNEHPPVRIKDRWKE